MKRRILIVAPLLVFSGILVSRLVFRDTGLELEPETALPKNASDHERESFNDKVAEKTSDASQAPLASSLLPKTSPSISSLPSTSPSHDDLSWFYKPQVEREFAIADPRYDGLLLKESEKERDHDNPWREKSFAPFDVSKIFNVTIRLLHEPTRPIQIRLKLTRLENSAELIPEWIRLKPPHLQEKLLHYSKFVSKFDEPRIYHGTLSFPYDPLWQSILPGMSCKEITWIHDGIFIEAGSDRVTGFDGRIFCRTGLRSLRGIAHFSGS